MWKVIKVKALTFEGLLTQLNGPTNSLGSIQFKNIYINNWCFYKSIVPLKHDLLLSLVYVLILAVNSISPFVKKNA